MTHHYELSYSDRIIEEFRDMPRTLLQEFIKGIQLTIASFCALELAKLALFPPISPELRAIWQMVGRGPRSESSIASLPRKIKKIPNRSVQISNTISIQAALLDSPSTSPILLWEFLRRLKTAGLDQDTREMSFEEFIRLPNNQVLLQPIIVGQAVTYTLMHVTPKPRNPIWGRTKDVRGIFKRFNVGLKISPLQISTLLGTSLQDSAKYNITPVPVHNLPLKEVIRLCRPENQHYLVIQNTLSYAQQRKYTFRPWTVDRFSSMIRHEHVYFSFFPDFPRSPHSFYQACKKLTKMIKSDGDSILKIGKTCHDFFAQPKVRNLFQLPENKTFTVELYDRSNNALILKPDLKEWKLQQLYDALKSKQYLIHIIDPFLGKLPNYEWTKEYIRYGIYTMRSSFGKLFRPAKVELDNEKIKWIKIDKFVSSKLWETIDFSDIKSILPRNIENLKDNYYTKIKNYFKSPENAIKDEGKREVMEGMYIGMKNYQKSRAQCHVGFSPAGFVRNTFNIFMDQVQIRLTKKLSGYICLNGAPERPVKKIKDLDNSIKIELGEKIMESIFDTWNEAALKFRSYIYSLLDQFIKSINENNIKYNFSFIQNIVDSFPRLIFLLKKHSLNYPMKLFLGNIDTTSNLVLISNNGTVQFSGGELGHIRNALLSQKKKTIKWYDAQLNEKEKIFSFVDGKNGHLRFTYNIIGLRKEIKSCLPNFPDRFDTIPKLDPTSNSKYSFEFMQYLTNYGSRSTWNWLAGYEIDKSPTINEPQFAGFPLAKIEDGFTFKDRAYLTSKSIGKFAQVDWLPKLFHGITNLPVDVDFISRLPRINANREALNLCLQTLVSKTKTLVSKVNTTLKKGCPNANIPLQYFMLKNLKKKLEPIKDTLAKLSSLKSTTQDISRKYEILQRCYNVNSSNLNSEIPLGMKKHEDLKNLRNPLNKKPYPKSKLPYAIKQGDLQEGMHLALRHLIDKTNRMFSLTYRDDYLALSSDIRSLISKKLPNILSTLNLIKSRKNYHLYPKLLISDLRELICSKNYQLVIGKNMTYLGVLKKNKNNKKIKFPDKRVKIEKIIVEIDKLVNLLTKIKNISHTFNESELKKIFENIHNLRINSLYSDSEDRKIEWDKLDLQTYSFETLISRFFQSLINLNNTIESELTKVKSTEWYEAFKNLLKSESQFNTEKFQAKESVDKSQIIANKCGHYISFLRKWKSLSTDLKKKSPESFPVISTSLLRRWKAYFVDPFSAPQEKIKNFVYSKGDSTDLAEFSFLKEIEVNANNSIPHLRDESIKIIPEFPPEKQEDYLPLLKMLTHRICTIEPIYKTKKRKKFKEEEKVEEDTKRVKITSVNADKSFKEWLNSVTEPLEVVEENYKAHKNYFEQVKVILNKNPGAKSTIMVGETSLLQTFETLKTYFLDPERDKERKRSDKWKDKDDEGDDDVNGDDMVGDNDEDFEDSVERPDKILEKNPPLIEVTINLKKIRKLLTPLPNSKNFIPFLVYARQICFQGKKILEPFPSPTPQFRASIGNRDFYGQPQSKRYNEAYIFGHYQPIPSQKEEGKTEFELKSLYYVLKINPDKGDRFLLTTRLDRPSRSFPLFEDLDTMFRAMDKNKFAMTSEFVLGYHQKGHDDSIPPKVMQNRVQTLQDHMFRLFGVSTHQKLFGENKITEGDLDAIKKILEIKISKKSKKSKKYKKSVFVSQMEFRNRIAKSLNYFMNPTPKNKEKAKIFGKNIEKIYSLIHYFKPTKMNFPSIEYVSKNPIKSSEIKNTIIFSIGYLATHVAYYLNRITVKDGKKLKDIKISELIIENYDKLFSDEISTESSDVLHHFTSSSNTKWLSVFQYFLVHIFPEEMNHKTMDSKTNPQWPLNSPKIELTPRGLINLYLPFTSFNPIPYTPSGSDVIHAATDLGIRSLFNTVYTRPHSHSEAKDDSHGGVEFNPESILQKISEHGQASLEVQVDPLITKSLEISRQSEQLQGLTDTRPFHANLRNSRRKRSLEKKQVELVQVASHQGLAQQMRHLDHFRRNGIKGSDNKYVGRFQLERLKMDGGGKGPFSKEKNRWIYGTVFDHWDAQCVHHQISGRKVSPSYSSQLCNQCHRIGVKGFITKKSDTSDDTWTLTNSTFSSIPLSDIYVKLKKDQKKFTKGNLAMASRRLLQNLKDKKADKEEEYLILIPHEDPPVDPEIIFLPQGAGNWFYCPHCKTFQDRDVNAAYNLAKYNSLMQNSARCQLLLDRIASKSSDASKEEIKSLSTLILSRYITRKRGLERVKTSILKSVRNFFTNIINANLGMGNHANVLKWTNDVSVFIEFNNSPGYSAAIDSINLALEKLYEYGIAPKEEFEIPTSGDNFRKWLMGDKFYNKLINYSKNDFYTKHPKLKWFPDNLVVSNKNQVDINKDSPQDPR
ncbi:MAG: hypothetical protein ACTSYU_13310 [Promethearchaeota archaeon]